ncbi:hypothetical protein KCU98_g8567, partial [Aureobasidium melanogenum]
MKTARLRRRRVSCYGSEEVGLHWLTLQLAKKRVIYKEQTAGGRAKRMTRACKTYSSRDSHVVTHRSTNLPFNCLCMAERTGCPVFS